MANIIPFRAIRPAKDKVHMVVSRSIAVYSRRILNAKLETNPYSFLHVIKPDHFDKKRSKSSQLFKKVRAKFENFCDEEIIVKDDNESFYVYRQIKPEGTYTGIIAGVSIDDYINGKIKVHEQTLTKREKIFEKYLRICDFNAEPVLLTYPDQSRIEQVVETVTEKEPLFDYSTPDKLRHQLWSVDNYHNITELIEAFGEVDSVYIADGHHRSASSALLGKGKRKENYETLLDVLKTLNNAMLHFENLNKELRNQRNANNSLILDNGRLKNKINLLTKQIEDLKTELKQEF